MQKRVLLCIFVVAITTFIVYALVTRDEHPPSIFDQKSWPNPESPHFLDRDFWNLISRLR